MSPDGASPRPRPPFPTVLALAALSAAALTGCAGAGPSIYDVRRGIEQQVPQARFEPETQITLGRLSLGLAKKLVRLVADEEDEEELGFLFSLRKVEVGVYRVRLSRAEQEALTLPRSFERALRRGGWQTLVKTRDGGERTWVFLRPEVRPEGEILRSLYVVTWDGDELVLVHVDGRIDEIFKTLAEEDPEGFAALLVDELG
jgi:hypothetical protein